MVNKYKIEIVTNNMQNSPYFNSDNFEEIIELYNDIKCEIYKSKVQTLTIGSIIFIKANICFVHVEKLIKDKYVTIDLEKEIEDIKAYNKEKSDILTIEDE